MMCFGTGYFLSASYFHKFHCFWQTLNTTTLDWNWTNKWNKNYSTKGPKNIIKIPVKCVAVISCKNKELDMVKTFGSSLEMIKQVRWRISLSCASSANKRPNYLRRLTVQENWSWAIRRDDPTAKMLSPPITYMFHFSNFISKLFLNILLYPSKTDEI